MRIITLFLKFPPTVDLIYPFPPSSMEAGGIPNKSRKGWREREKQGGGGEEGEKRRDKKSRKSIGSMSAQAEMHSKASH